MAFQKGMGKKQKNIKEISLIDKDLLQQVQDYVCRVNGGYLSCICNTDGVVTKSYGTKRELEYIHKYVTEDVIMSMLLRLNESILENVIEEDIDECIKVCVIKEKIENAFQITWILVAVNDNGNGQVPEYISCCKEKDLYVITEFLSIITRHLMIVTLNEINTYERNEEKKESYRLLEEQLERNESMMEIVKSLESEDSFTGIVDKVLEKACRMLGIAGGCLYKINGDRTYVDMICEYVSEENYKFINEFLNVPKEDVPFFTENPYMISSNTIKPESFIKFFERYNMSAAVFLPVEINGKVTMYLCFYETEKEKIWDTTDVRYLSDVKRIIQSVLVKRLERNSMVSSYVFLESILDNIGCGICVLDTHLKKILFKNSKLQDIYINAYKENKLEETLLTECDEELIRNYEEVYSFDEEKWFDIYRNQISWVDGRKVLLCIIYDVTDKKMYQEKIENQANNDFLTGLYNRMRCEQDLERFIRKAEISSVEGAVLYIDLDDFKNINDGLGHQCGDILLKAISNSLLKIEEIDRQCYRMGGDEFIVILEKTDKETLERVCNKIMHIFNNPWILKGDSYYCTSSIGIAFFPTDANTVDDAIRKADMALYTAKRKGKNCIEFYSEEDERGSARRLDIEMNMRSVVMNSGSEFEVYYQPIIDLEKPGNKCCGAEALVRWNSKTLGFLQPDDFIPLAEYLGLITPIGNHVIMEAAKKCRHWNDMGHPEYKVNVNISVIQLMQDDFFKKIRNVLAVSGLNPSNLRLEITESIAISDTKRLQKILAKIKELGVEIALDDFGTGYSSLDRIRQLPMDMIKIDRCFIENIAKDDFSSVFVEMSHKLSKVIGVDTCAEGVETKEQLDIVKAMGIRYVQGFYFGKPMQDFEFEDKYIIKNKLEL